MPEKEYSFSNYANFRELNETPDLPIKNTPDMEKVDIASGSYCSVIEIDDKRVAKISRMLAIRGGKVVAQSQRVGKYLVEKTGDSDKESEQDRNSVISKLQSLAREKYDTYELLGEYIGEYLPRLEMFAIVDSPRKEIENRFRNPNAKVLEQVPNSEISLMEIWERIDTRDNFQSKNYEQLRDALSNPEVKEVLKKFGNDVLRLFTEKRFMLDICDGEGIRGRDAFGKPVQIEVFDEVSRIKTAVPEHGLIYPKNTVYTKGKLWYYDTYPVWKINRNIDDAYVMVLRDKLKAGDWDSLKELTQSDNEELAYDQLDTLRYLVLLKTMGAEL